MPTQEERLSTLEKSMMTLNATISDITHNETMLLGMLTKQEDVIREVHTSFAALNERLDRSERNSESRLEVLERSVNSRFETQQRMIESFEQHVNSRFETLEQSINSRFEAQEKRLDEHTALLTQILARLPEKP